MTRHFKRQKAGTWRPLENIQSSGSVLSLLQQYPSPSSPSSPSTCNPREESSPVWTLANGDSPHPRDCLSHACAPIDGYHPPALNPGVRFFKPHEPLNEQCSVGGPPKSSQKGGWDWVVDGGRVHLMDRACYSTVTPTYIHTVCLVCLSACLPACLSVCLLTYIPPLLVTLSVHFLHFEVGTW